MTTEELMVWLTQRLDRLDDALAALHDKVNNIDLTTARNTTDLEYHIRRTDLLESKIALDIEAVGGDIKPMKVWLARLQAIGWLAGGIISLGGLYKALQTVGWVP